MSDRRFIKADVFKVNADLGLVFGWGMVCKEDGLDYYDLQGDHIPEPVMLEGSTEFMKFARVAKDMHTGEQIGSVIHSFPLTTEIAAAYGITTKRTGWMIAMKPNTREILEKFISGERRGFSIGGMCSYVEEAA